MSNRYYKPADRTRFVAVPPYLNPGSATWYLYDRMDGEFIAEAKADWCQSMAAALNRDTRIAPLDKAIDHD